MIADLGAHPESGDAIQVKTGRFGPYVTDGTVNATVPKGTDPEKVDLEQGRRAARQARGEAPVTGQRPASEEEAPAKEKLARISHTEARRG